MVIIISYSEGQGREVREGLGKEATGGHSEHRLSGVKDLSLNGVARAMKSNLSEEASVDNFKKAG